MESLKPGTGAIPATHCFIFGGDMMSDFIIMVGGILCVIGALTALAITGGNMIKGENQMLKHRCYDLSREPGQVELCKELFGDK